MSTLRVTTLQTTSGVEVYTCKAWVNFNGTGTVAIRASGNVSSITDNGVGDYTVNFSSAMTDLNYAAVATHGAADGSGRFGGAIPVTTSQARLRAQDAAGGAADYPNIFSAIFR